MLQEDSTNSRVEALSELERLSAVWRAVNISFSSAKEPFPDNYDRADLIQVCRYGDLPALQELITQKVDLHEKNELALRWAATNGHVEMVRVLLDQGLNVQFARGSALLCAVMNKHFKTVDLLVEYGAFFDGITTEQREAYDAAQFEEQRIKAQQDAVRAMAKQSLGQIFNTKNWLGHVAEMKELWDKVPKALQGEIDFSHILSEVSVQNMKLRKHKAVLIK